LEVWNKDTGIINRVIQITVASIVNTNTFCTIGVWEHFQNLVLGLVLGYSTVIFHQIVLHLSFGIDHNQEITSHSNIDYWSFLLLIMWESSHLLDIIFDLMKEDLAIS